MWKVTERDFEEIKSWGLEQYPFRAVSDYSDLKATLRWLNPEHREVYTEYISKRLEYIQNKDFDDYYKKANKPIDRRRWEYLMLRKAWYIMPLGWEQMARSAEVVADMGCGDGDTTQRFIDFVNKKWQREGITDRKINVVGVDLNHSRVKNALCYVRSENPNITCEFHQRDVVGEGTNLPTVSDRDLKNIREIFLSDQKYPFF